jgi:hypothetical protein
MGTAGVTDWDAVLWDLTLGCHYGIAVPVLCVPLGAKYNPIKTIGFTPDTEIKIKMRSTQF